MNPDELRQGILAMEMPSEELRMNFLKEIAEIQNGTKPKRLAGTIPAPAEAGRNTKSAADGDAHEDQAATVIDAIEQASDAYTMLYDTKTNETVYLPDVWITGETDEDLAELIEKEPERFLRFPTKYEIHEYSIMDSFVDDLPAGRIKSELAGAIRGKGAFRRFKQTIRFQGVEQLWYDYQANAYRELAERWCNENDIQFE